MGAFRHHQVVRVLRIETPPKTVESSSFRCPEAPAIGDEGWIVEILEDAQGQQTYLVESVVATGEFQGYTKWVAAFGPGELGPVTSVRGRLDGEPE